MKDIDNLINQRFGKLIAIKPTSEKSKSGHTIWLCQCDCGNLIKVRIDNLKSGNTTACGCVRKKHGDAILQTRLYRTWEIMKARCYNPNFFKYERYGGRGIKVFDEWKNNYVAFKKWAMTNGYADNLTIDRINNDGDYSPDNCQWITQSENTKKYFKEQRKLESIDAYVEEKAREALKSIGHWHILNPHYAFESIKDFIHTILSDVRNPNSDKPKVSRKFVEEESYRLEWTDKDELRREDKLPTTLRNAGVEVTDK